MARSARWRRWRFEPVRVHLMSVVMVLEKLRRRAVEALRLVSFAIPVALPDIHVSQTWHPRFVGASWWRHAGRAHGYSSRSS